MQDRLSWIRGEQTIDSYFHFVFVSDGVLADPVMRQDGKSEALSIHRAWRTLLTLWFLALWCCENSVSRARNQSWVLPVVKKWVGRSLAAKETGIQTGHQNLLGQCQTPDIDMAGKLLKYRFKPTFVIYPVKYTTTKTHCVIPKNIDGRPLLMRVSSGWMVIWIFH